MRRIDERIRGWLSPDRKPHTNWTIPRTPAEMRTWRELPDPKLSYQAFVGIPVADDEPEFGRVERGARGESGHKVTYTRKTKEK